MHKCMPATFTASRYRNRNLAGYLRRLLKRSCRNQLIRVKRNPHYGRLALWQIQY